MKNLLFALLFFSCTKEVSTQNPTNRVEIRNNTEYWGYPLHAIQRNQDSSFRVTYISRGSANVPGATVTVLATIRPQNLTISRPFATPLLWIERVNNQPTGRYIAEVPANFTIGSFTN